jgi:hypothetical protein
MQRALSSVPRWTAWHAPGSLAHAAESYAAAVAGLSSNGSGSDGAAGSANSRWVPLAAGKSSSEWITAIQQFYGGFDYTALRPLQAAAAGSSSSSNLTLLGLPRAEADGRP